MAVENSELRRRSVADDVDSNLVSEVVLFSISTPNF